MRASEAWKKYGRDNGVENLSQLISRTDKYKAKHTEYLCYSVSNKLNPFLLSHSYCPFCPCHLI